MKNERIIFIFHLLIPFFTSIGSLFNIVVSLTCTAYHHSTNNCHRSSFGNLLTFVEKHISLLVVIDRSCI
jgi:hypothetical protein